MPVHILRELLYGYVSSQRFFPKGHQQNIVQITAQAPFEMLWLTLDSYGCIVLITRGVFSNDDAGACGIFLADDPRNFMEHSAL
jgi:hypothetical protein